MLWPLTLLAAEGPTTIVGEARIPPLQSKSWRFVLPSAIPAGKAVVLSLEARLDFPRLAGSTTAMKVEVNGEPLEQGALVNKPLFFGWRGLLLSWYGMTSWRVAYSPDFESTEGYEGVDGKVYKFEFDITGLARPGRNELRLSHIIGSIESPLVVRNVEVKLADASLLPRRREKEGRALRVYEPRPPRKVPYSLEVEPSGGMVVVLGGEVFRIASKFSHPGPGWNSLGNGGGEPGWGPTAGRKGPREWTVKAKGRWYSVSRRVVAHDEWIEVEDTIVNLSGEDIPVMVRHTASPRGEPRSLFLCGLPMGPTWEARVRRHLGNPSALVVTERAALGLLPVDDVFFLHCASNFSPSEGAIGIGDEEFALPAGDRYTMRWLIFPVPKPDGGWPLPSDPYWDFVNVARRALDVNFTIEGPFGFLSLSMLEWSDEKLKRWLELRGLRFASGTIGKFPDGRYAHGTGFLHVPENHKKWRKLFDRIRRLAPNVKLLMYFHSFISTEPGAPEKYPEDRVLDPRGRQVKYPYRYPLPLFYPTLENRYGRELRKYFEVIFDVLGCDGVYWDEMAHTCVDYTYDRWDRRSADVDRRTFRIARKKAALPLICQPWKVRMVREALGRGKRIVANGSPLTETMRRFKFPRFQETASIWNIVRGHLYTPIGLGDHLTIRSELDEARQMRMNLDVGGLFYFYPVVGETYEKAVSRMFPFTPVEIREGVLIGRERIITNRSGIFGFGDRSGHEVYIYGPEGREVGRGEGIEGLSVRTFERGGKVYTELRLPPRFLAVIERREASTEGG